MSFCWYPNHEYGCEHLRHCPHVGGAAIGALVLAANDNEEFHLYLHGTIDFERKQNAELFAENQRLQAELEQVKLELKLERQNKFATNQQKQADADAPVAKRRKASKKKLGAPIGHPGWFRPTCLEYDQLVDVAAPSHCPHCNGKVASMPQLDATDHLQEDILDGRYQIVLYRHPAAQCEDCKAWVQQAGEGEILFSRIGPQLRSKAVFLRNVIGISYRKVPEAIDELFGIRFTPAALLGFEASLAEKAESVVEDIAKKLGSSDGAVHADETYWMLDGERSFYWVHGDEKLIHFQFDTSRSGQVSRDVLGEHFTGTLVTDCYAGYHAHAAGAKQKCLAHLARTARDWQKLVERGTKDYRFFSAVRRFVKRACQFHQQRRDGEITEVNAEAEASRLKKALLKLLKSKVAHEKAITLQNRIIQHVNEWLVFVDDPRVPPTNNLAERALRPLVILRKITFGHRSHECATRMARLMTVAETAKRQGHRASKIFYDLYMRPPDRVLQSLYAEV